MNPVAEPEDVAALKARLAAAEAALADRETALAALAEANRRLEQIIEDLRRGKFGPLSPRHRHPQRSNGKRRRQNREMHRE